MCSDYFKCIIFCIENVEKSKCHEKELLLILVFVCTEEFEEFWIIFKQRVGSLGWIRGRMLWSGRRIDFVLFGNLFMLRIKCQTKCCPNICKGKSVYSCF